MNEKQNNGHVLDQEKNNNFLSFITDQDPACIVDFQRHHIQSIGERLGKGSYGNVYVVKTKNDQQYALKIMMHDTDVKHHEFHKNIIQNEIEMLNILYTAKVKWVPKFYGSWTCNCVLDEKKKGCDTTNHTQKKNDCYFILMEAFECDLSHHLTTSRPDIELYSQMFEIALELGAMGIVHGDLKLSQFLIRFQPQSKRIARIALTDFGFSTRIDETTETASNAWCRTVWDFSKFRIPNKITLIERYCWAMYMNVLQLIAALAFEPRLQLADGSVLVGFEFNKDDTQIFQSLVDPVQLSAMHKYINYRFAAIQAQQNKQNKQNTTSSFSSSLTYILNLSNLLPPVFHTYKKTRTQPIRVND